MLYIELLKYTRAIRFYALKRQKQGLCITIHFTIAHSIAFLVAQSEIVNFSPKRSYLLIKGLKISIFEPFTGGGTYAQRAVQVLDFRPMLVFLDTKSKFRIMFPDSLIITSLSLVFQIRVSSLFIYVSPLHLFLFF